MDRDDKELDRDDKLNYLRLYLLVYGDKMDRDTRMSRILYEILHIRYYDPEITVEECRTKLIEFYESELDKVWSMEQIEGMEYQVDWLRSESTDPLTIAIRVLQTKELLISRGNSIGLE